MPFSIERNDLLNVRADVLVVPDSCNLDMGGGVSLAIARAAGEDALRAAAAACAPVEPGSAVALPSGRLADERGVKALVFAVGPVWQGGGSGEKLCLRAAYRSALGEVARIGAESVALPLISTGAFGFPVRLAMDIALEEIRAFTSENDIDVTLALFGSDAFSEGRSRFPELAALIDDAYVVRRGCSENLARGTRPARDAEPASGGAAENAESAGAKPFAMAEAPSMAVPAVGESLEAWLAKRDEPLADTLLKLIDERGLTDAQVYRRANISKQVFNKIKNNPAYRPGKPTVLALCVSLELDLADTAEVLSRAGYAFNPSDPFDLIVQYYIARGVFDHFAINEALFSFDQPLLGGK